MTAVSPTIRTIAAIVSMFIPLGVVLGSFLFWQDRLPAEIASHWSGTGPADGVMTGAQFLTVAIVMTGVPALAALIVGVWPGVGAAVRRNSFLIAGIVAGAGAQSWLVPTSLTMSVGDPYKVVLGAWSILGLAAAAYGLIPFFIAPKPTRVAHDVEDRIDLAPGEGGAWSRTITARLFLWATIVLVIAGVSLYADAAVNDRLPDVAGGLIVIAVLTVIVASFSRYQVTVDWRGLRVVSFLLRFPLKRVSLRDLDTVEAAELVPMEWGGWGYRIIPGRSAVILRKGPGLIVTSRNQKQFAITLDDPEVPAALLATLRDKSRAQSQPA